MDAQPRTRSALTTSPDTPGMTSREIGLIASVFLIGELVTSVDESVP